jgi:peptidoglycan/xylan/chitin deacetylase (PgdA/CDA1 family)
MTMPRGAIGSWALKRALYHSGLLALARLARQRGRALVLRYHALTDGTPDTPYAAREICLPVGAFRLQMAFVRRAYSVLPLGELVRALTAGRPLPPRALTITFDDGYADNHRLAAPVLREFGLPATVYVATGGVDGGPPLWTSAVRVLVAAAGHELRVPGTAPLPLGSARQRAAAVRRLTDTLVPLPAAERTARIAAVAEAVGVDVAATLRGAMLTWAQLRELATTGWTIGAHTVTHVNVALAPAAEAEDEIGASRDAIAAVVREPVVHFAYPNSGGRHRYFDAEVTGILRRLGFHSGATSQPGALRAGTDPFALPRLGVSPRLGDVVDLAAAIERQRLAA